MKIELAPGVVRHEVASGHALLIVRIENIRPLLARGRVDPQAVFPELRKLAASDQWQTREVAATALVEIGRRHPAAVLRAARRWARARDVNVRRAASEGLRGIVKLDPETVRPVLETLRADPEMYVKKSVANVLRNASVKHPDFVLGVCRRWARSSNPHTRWIVADGLRKLKLSRAPEVAAILAARRVGSLRRRSEPSTGEEMTHSIRRAVTDEEILSCHPVLSELRPHVRASELVPAVRRMEKEGYRLAFLSDSGKVQAVVGYRMIEMLRTAKMIEVDDLITAGETRSKGYGSVLLDWVFREARENQCRFVELDSAVHRADAHRFYFRERMHVLGFHFSIATA